MRGMAKKQEEMGRRRGRGEGEERRRGRGEERRGEERRRGRGEERRGEERRRGRGRGVAVAFSEMLIDRVNTMKNEPTRSLLINTHRHTHTPRTGH